MDIYLDDHYPADAAYGADFLTRAAQGDVQVETADGIVFRKEKVLITSREEDFEGRICIGERTIRHLAHQLGLVDDWRVARIANDNSALRGELVALSEQLGTARQEAARLAQLERPDPEVVFVAIDDSRHASPRAAIEKTAKVLSLEPAMLLDAVATADPNPNPAPVEVPR